MAWGWKKKKAAQKTFKDRVAEFWEWYQQDAAEIYSTIEDGTFENIQPKVMDSIHRTLGDLSWVFGPGENGGHSFTVTGEGQIARQLLAEYWQACAPEIEGWTFYASRQPSDAETLAGIAIEIPDCGPVEADNFLIRATADAENARFDIVAWHPSFASVPEDHHFQLLFLMLDEALGEFGTQTRIGSIEIEPVETGDDVYSLTELPRLIREAEDYYEWQKLPPTECYTLFEIPDGFDDHQPVRRFGMTCIPTIISDLIEHDGTLPEDPLEGTGAELIAVAVDLSVFPEGREAEVRGEIEDKVSEKLEGEMSGRTLGGSWGQDSAFIDIIIFDGDDSRAFIGEALKSMNIASECRLLSLC